MYTFDKGECIHINPNTSEVKVPRVGDIITFKCMEIIQKTGVPRMSVYKGICKTVNRSQLLKREKTFRTC